MNPSTKSFAERRAELREATQRLIEKAQVADRQVSFIL